MLHDVLQKNVCWIDHCTKWDKDNILKIWNKFSVNFYKQKLEWKTIIDFPYSVLIFGVNKLQNLGFIKFVVNKINEPSIIFLNTYKLKTLNKIKEVTDYRLPSLAPGQCVNGMVTGSLHLAWSHELQRKMLWALNCSQIFLEAVKYSAGVSISWFSCWKYLIAGLDLARSHITSPMLQLNFPCG